MRLLRYSIALTILAGHSALPGQLRGVESVMELGGRKLAVAPDEMRALGVLGNVLQSGGTGEQDRALLLARRVAHSADARYALATYEFELGRKRSDDALQASALDKLLASGLLPAKRVPGHLGVRGQLALKAGDGAGAEKAWSKLSQLEPGEPGHLINLSQALTMQENWQAASERLKKAIELQSAAGAKVPEVWIRQKLGIAQRGRLKRAGIEAALALVESYPTSGNWRASLMGTYDLLAPNGDAEIDLLRLLRRTSAFQHATEYLRFAQLLRQAGQPSEAKVVIGEGVSRGLIDRGTSPTREIFAEIERALEHPGALTSASAKPSRVAVLVSDGRAKLDAGQREAAIQSFEAAASVPEAGDHAVVAKLWAALATGQANPGTAAPSPAGPTGASSSRE